MRRAEQEAGFTLLEILVALTIFALTGVALLGSFGTGARLSFEASRHAKALALAEARLALAASEPPLRYGEETGETEDGLFWRVRVAPFDPDADDEEASFAMVALTAETSDHDWRETAEPLARLSTLRFTAVR